MSDRSQDMFAWMVANLELGSVGEFVTLGEIKSKFPGEATPKGIGYFIKKIFPNVTVKRARSGDDWTERIHKYCGLRWKQVPDNKDVQFGDLPTIPDDFFLMTKSESEIKLGHFSGEIVNGQKVLIEISLYRDKTWNFLVMDKVISPAEVNVPEHYNIETVFQMASHLRLCEGVNCEKLIHNDAALHESVRIHGKDNTVNRYRSKGCKQILKITSSSSSKEEKTCIRCKQMENTIKTSAKSDDVPLTSTSDEANVTLSEADNEDMTAILENVFPNCTAKIKTFLLSQKQSLECHPNGRRWDKDIIRLCLTLWCRSPKGYTELRSSGFVVLPSEKTLQIFKNKVHQESGINKEMLHWMKNEANLKNIPTEGRQGGLIIDEMSIQPDLQFKKRNGSIQLIGFTELHPESLVFEKMRTQKNERTLATHVLQFLFLGFTGFRFPFAHFPSTTASGRDMYLLIWKAVLMLMNFGFFVEFVSTDGAQSNRDLMKYFIPGFSSLNPITCGFKNLYKRSLKIFFIMDISHVIKKIRNNIIKSGSAPYCKRHLKYDNKFIEWDHFKNAYLWDISSHPFPLHHRLTRDHFFLTSEAKMRNQLAEDVLNRDMLNLLEKYQDSLPGEQLQSTIELVKNTSILVSIFRDRRPIIYRDDERLEKIHGVMDFFVKWETQNMADKAIRCKEKSLISHQTRQDIISCTLGFEEMCNYKLGRSNCSIIPSRVNSDVIENVFCQQRTLHNGANTNPTYLGYCHAMNSVILGQASISRKSNAGGEHVPTPLAADKKRAPLQPLSLKRAPLQPLSLNVPRGSQQLKHLSQAAGSQNQLAFHSDSPANSYS